MSAVLAAGRVASVGAQSPVSSGVYPCLALRPCSVEVARTINQSAAKIINGKGMPLVQFVISLANKVVAKIHKVSEAGPAGAVFDDLLGTTAEISTYPTYP